jgi:hypothetical protein
MVGVGSDGADAVRAEGNIIRVAFVNLPEFPGTVHGEDHDGMQDTLFSAAKV